MLTTIAASLIVIAINLSVLALSPRPPAFGEFAKIEAMDDSPNRHQEYEKLLNRMPLVFVHRGNIDAEITGGKVKVTGGSIEVSGTVPIDDASSRMVPLNRR